MPDPRPLASLVPADRPEPVAARPPRRFEEATFSGYRPGNESQERACREVREFVASFSSGAGKRRFGPGRLLLGALGRRKQHDSGAARGIYLDGGYGVGKTHLLAAAFHAAAAPRAYLTFQELVHRIGALGLARASELVAPGALLCLDEFELDDPGNTLIVKRFLEHLFGTGGAVITTSNTPPEAQGRGRFNAEDFQREIQGIAGRFRTIRVDGRDYRRLGGSAVLLTDARLERACRRLSGTTVTGTFDELMSILGRLHPVHYGAVVEEFDLLCLSGLRPIPHQNDALRFVHFVDWLYNSRKGLLASGAVSLGELFDGSYRHGAFSRKHERCLSRLAQLLSETAAAQSAALEAAD